MRRESSMRNEPRFFWGQSLGRRRGAFRATVPQKGSPGLVVRRTIAAHGAIPWLFPLIPRIPRLLLQFYGATIVTGLATPVALIAVTATSSGSVEPKASVIDCPANACRTTDDHFPSRLRI